MAPVAVGMTAARATVWLSAFEGIGAAGIAVAGGFAVRAPVSTLCVIVFCAIVFCISWAPIGHGLS